MGNYVIVTIVRWSLMCLYDYPFRLGSLKPNPLACLLSSLAVNGCSDWIHICEIFKTRKKGKSCFNLTRYACQSQCVGNWHPALVKAFLLQLASFEVRSIILATRLANGEPLFHPPNTSTSWAFACRASNRSKGSRSGALSCAGP